MGVAGGVHNLQWLFISTFLTMLVAVPIFGSIVARFPRRRFVPLVYCFFIVNIVIFYFLFVLGEGQVHIARAFFIWVSVYNLFIVSVFWSFMADLFRNPQGKRLFGFIAAGGSAGAFLSSTLTVGLAVPLGHLKLLLISALFLEIAVQCIKRLVREFDGWGEADAASRPAGAREDGVVGEAIGGGIFAGITEALKSPYLLGIGLYIVLYTTTSTFLYFQQANIVAAAFDNPAERTRLFAMIDLAIAVLTIATQLFVTGRLVGWIGVGAAAAFIPLVSIIGFAVLATAPVIAVLIAFQALRRAANFAVSRPAREILFTVVSRERKYKSKNFIDTAVYRGGDAASGWAFAGLRGLLGTIFRLWP